MRKNTTRIFLSLTTSYSIALVYIVVIAKPLRFGSIASAKPAETPYGWESTI